MDFAALKRFPNKLALGMTGYAWQQVTPDAGSGTRLGPIKGRVFGLGPLVTYDAQVGNTSISLIGKYISEFGAQYRFQGNSGWLELAVTL